MAKCEVVFARALSSVSIDKDVSGPNRQAKYLACINIQILYCL